MAQVTVREITDPKIWEGFILLRPEGNFLQSWWWGEFHRKLGHEIIRRGYYQNNRLEGVSLAVIENAKRARYLTVPAGPIINWQNKMLVKTWISDLKNIAVAKRCVFVRVRPQLLQNQQSEKLFRGLGFKPSPIHLHAQLTNQLDITPDENTLLANMRKSTRYEIRKAQKLGINIQVSSDPADIKSFYELQLNTAKRQGFVPFGEEFLTKQFQVFAGQNLALLFFAKLGSQLLAEAVIIYYGHEAVYHYGASADAGRKYPGAYLIQWEAILEAKRRGLTRYNFWGVAHPHDTKHRFYPLSVFKRGFGGTDVAYLPAHDLVMQPLGYAVNFLVEYYRKITRRV